MSRASSMKCATFFLLFTPPHPTHSFCFVLFARSKCWCPGVMSGCPALITVPDLNYYIVCVVLCPPHFRLHIVVLCLALYHFIDQNVLNCWGNTNWHWNGFINELELEMSTEMSQLCSGDEIICDGESPSRLKMDSKREWATQRQMSFTAPF